MKYENDKENNLHHQLNRPPVPKALKEMLQENWEEQVENNKSTGLSVNKNSYFAMAASFIIVFVTWFSIDTTPQYVYLALNDIADEDKHNHAAAIDMNSIIKEFRINALPVSTKVKMTKYCSLAQQRTAHLEIVHDDQEMMHVFLSKDELVSQAWQKNAGQLDQMTWKYIQPRPGLNVLIFFNDVVDEKAVNKLSQQFFYI